MNGILIVMFGVSCFFYYIVLKKLEIMHNDMKKLKQQKKKKPQFDWGIYENESKVD